MRIHIVRRTGAPQGEHAFLGHPWWQNGSDRGIAWGVLESPSIKSLLGVINAQRAEEAILCPQYLIGATRAGSNALCLDPTARLPLPDLIFLHKDDDLRAWLLPNDGKHPLDLMVLESRLEEAGDDRSMPEPVGGRHRFFDRNVWDHSRQAEDIVGGIQWDDEDDEDDEYDHIVVRNRRMRQHSGERWDEMEDMDDDEDDKGADGAEDDSEADEGADGQEDDSEDDEGADGQEVDSEEDVAKGGRESQMTQERHTIVIDISLLCFSYLEEYQTQ